MNQFQVNDPSLECQWRALILFGKNTATFKFAFAKSLLELVDEETTRISLNQLAEPFSRNILNHLRENDKQGNNPSSTFLNDCRDHLNGKLTEDELLSSTEKYGFRYVVDAFQNVNGGNVPDQYPSCTKAL